MLQEYRQQLLPLREQAEMRNHWLRQRLDTIIPALLERENMDMWLVVAREYNEDPVIMSMLPAPAMSARRRTILAFCRNADGTVDRLTLDRYGHGDFYEPVWNPEREGQYQCLARIVHERDPRRIGLNYSKHFAFGDGLSHNEYFELAEALGDRYMARFKSATRLALGWLETRIPAELKMYPFIVAMGHTLIKEAFSTHVIEIGKTTTEDVVWWMRQTMHDMGLQAWFQPDCEIQAPGQRYDAQARRTVIQAGDLLWCDVGFYYMGLATDQQQHAYVLHPDETDAPRGLQTALAQGNRLQDIHMEQMQIGRTGNDVLHATLAQARAESIEAQVYSHPLGFHGHAAGPTIGLWDQQDGVTGKGDYELFDYTAYSIELNVRYNVPEWNGQQVRIALEEDAVLADGQMHWLDGRLERLHLIG